MQKGVKQKNLSMHKIVFVIVFCHIRKEVWQKKFLRIKEKEDSDIFLPSLHLNDADEVMHLYKSIFTFQQLNLFCNLNGKAHDREALCDLEDICITCRAKNAAIIEKKMKQKIGAFDWN